MSCIPSYPTHIVLKDKAIRKDKSYESQQAKYKLKYKLIKQDNAELHEKIIALEAEKLKWKTKYKDLKHNYKKAVKRIDKFLQ